jgi:hypothetical protein
MRMGSHCYVPSCQAPKTAASRGPERVMLIHYKEPSGMLVRGPESLPWVIKRGGRGRQVIKFYLPTLIVEWRGDDVDRFRD